MVSVCRRCGHSLAESLASQGVQEHVLCAVPARVCSERRCDEPGVVQVAITKRTKGGRFESEETYRVCVNPCGPVRPALGPPALSCARR